MSAARASALPPPSRAWVWAQLLVGWMPVLALYATILVAMHGGSPVHALLISLRAIGTAALLSPLVIRFTERLPWPRPVPVSFVLIHSAAALAFACTWVAATMALESLISLRISSMARPGIVSFIIMGIWLYVAVTGVAYAASATARAARAEAAAAQAQLAALRGQLNPHFLFNALHTVVQLIPVEPARAAEAAERLAMLLRTALDEERDLLTLREERRFVEDYLAVEQLRFGERLVVRFDVAATLDEALVPSFVLQTLVENAVRHGAAPREAATTVMVTIRAEGDRLAIEVRDDGAGSDEAVRAASAGTGLRRLRDRLQVLHGGAASLELRSAAGAGCIVTIRLPLVRDEES